LRTEIRERLRRSRDWSIAIDELEREADAVKNERERSEFLFDIGRLTEEVIPERDRALALYQRAWKLYPDNVKALTRARQVYRELGRLEMVAKVGELELEGIDYLTLDAEGRVADLTVFMRPLKAVNAFNEQMKARLEAAGAQG